MPLPAPVNPNMSALSGAGLTPAVPVEASAPGCAFCVWVLVHLSPVTWALKFCSPDRCDVHSYRGLVPWPRHSSDYWVIGRAS